ncbi:MAG TPA: hypothetical protein VGU43_07120 [Thermoplasmata archaeon]|nr:hypothetical protein [Thermoplasmata archaeon]
MPLILNLDGWSHDRLTQELTDYGAAFTQMAEMFGTLPPNLPNRWAAELAATLCRQSAALAQQLVGLDGLSPPVAAAAVNQLYELQNAIPYLMKAAQLPPPAFPSRKGAPSAPPP